MKLSNVHNLPGFPHAMRRNRLGFSLIEVMVVLIVLSILATIAYTSYQNSVVQTRRQLAAGCLIEAAQFMERYYTTNLTYLNAAMPALSCRTDLAPFYTVELNGAATATGFSVRAVPLDLQLARDGTKCGTLGLNERGTKSATGTDGLACW